MELKSTRMLGYMKIISIIEANNPYKNTTAKVYGFFEMLKYDSSDDVIMVKIETIANELKCSRKTIIRSILKMESDGILIVERYWQNFYRFLPNVDRKK